MSTGARLFQSCRLVKQDQAELAELRWGHFLALQVRDAMSHIWHALLDDPKAAVTQNVDGELGGTARRIWCVVSPADGCCAARSCHGRPLLHISASGAADGCVSGCAVPQPCPAACAAIMKALLADIGGAQWRVRESAALAMADLLQASPGRWQGVCPGCWLSHAEH